MIERQASSYSHYSSIFWGNLTSNDVFGNATDFDSNLKPAKDVSVDAVLTSFYFNSIVFVMLMITYECLRRLLPHVYSSRRRLAIFSTGLSGRNGLNGGLKNVAEASSSELPEERAAESNRIQFSRSGDDENGDDDDLSTVSPLPPLADIIFKQNENTSIQESDLPDDQPLDWIQPVVGVPWTTIRRIAGLDGYFFLRFIRLAVRITAVSTFWFFLVLVPVYMSGNNNALGWYHLSAANIDASTWKMWMPVVFSYLFSGFTIFVLKQEYRHFLELRQDYLARGSAYVLPQNRYSLMVENIPYELRSDKALFDYFDKLFPGKVHSASVVLKVPELEKTSRRCMRTCRRLEKSIAYLHATHRRPSHKVGQGRMSVMGLDMEPVETNPTKCCCCFPETEPLMVKVDTRRDSIESAAHKPPRGTRVDSISYYTMELAEYSRQLSELQRSVRAMAESGKARNANGWLDKVLGGAEALANQIMIDSLQENSLIAPSSSYFSPAEKNAEHMTSQYGTLGLFEPSPSKSSRLLHQQDDHNSSKAALDPPFSKDLYKNKARRWAGRLGLDFAVAGLRLLNKQVDVTVEGVIGSTVSSTGFVTFLDLSTTTCAMSAPLTVKASALLSTVAPEPREVNWENVHVAKTTILRREQFVNIVLFLGVILWSFPLAAIQAFAKAEYLAQLPGMGWIMTFHGGTLTSFVNGYLPVIALLGLILILPVIFQFVATMYERRKTFSDVQSSMLTRYFFYQLANIYVTVTAGSVLKSLADILDHPSNILDLLGESLPSMVGYFVALLVTKIMAGLPMVFLRFGALFRMLMLRLLVSSERKVTQRELDWVYRLENVQYGWEFPTQLLVVVIVFTYAIICPVILPVGLVYFLGALVVYKKQILFIYSPVFESGGALFPVVVQRTLFGLICSQMILIGYLATRGCFYQPTALLPLTLITVWVMMYFGEHFGVPSTRLSLERARHYDRSLNVHGGSHRNLDTFTDDTVDHSALNVEERRKIFDKNSYRQPVLTEYPALPWMYRRGVDDSETVRVRDQLRRIGRLSRNFSEEFGDNISISGIVPGCVNWKA